MEELFGISNLGFSFTDTYLNNIVDLIDYVNKNRLKTESYIDLQKHLGNPSRYRMIIPFLRYIGIIDNSNFESSNETFLIGGLFSEQSKAFIYCCEIYGLIKQELKNSQIEEKWKELFKIILLKKYLINLVKNKNEYLLFIKFLLKYKSIDKFEFFVITSFKYNNIKNLFGKNNENEVIDFYRLNGINSSEYSYSSNVNSFSYIMQVLSDFNVCERVNNKYVLKNENEIKQVLEELL